MTQTFPTISNQYRTYPYDKLLELRDLDATAISATASETALEFNPIDHCAYKVIVIAEAYTGYVSTSAEWNITVEVSDTSGGSYTQVGTTIAPVGDAGRFVLPLSGDYVQEKDADATVIRVTATKTGSPGNLTYGAFIIPM